MIRKAKDFRKNSLKLFFFITLVSRIEFTHSKYDFFFIFLNIFHEIKRLFDITGHTLLDIYIMHVFTSNFKLSNALLANKTDFLFLRKKYKKFV